MNQKTMTTDPTTRVDSFSTCTAIADLLDGKVWSPDTLNQIAELLRAAGFQIREEGETP